MYHEPAIQALSVNVSGSTVLASNTRAGIW